MFKTNGTRQYKMPSTGVSTVMASIEGRRLMREKKETLLLLAQGKQLAVGLEKMTKAELTCLLLEAQADDAQKREDKELEEAETGYIYWE